MLVQGCPFCKKKVNVQKTLDYGRLCAAVCREWSYITPDYFFLEMDTWDINKLVGMMDPKLYAACWISSKKSHNLDAAEADGVLRRKG